jgi:hypothetical protein
MHVKLLVYIYSLCKKLKVMFFPVHAVKLYGERRFSSIHFFTWTLDGGEWWGSRLGGFTIGENSPRYRLKRSLGRLQRRLGEEKMVLLSSGFEPRGVQPVTHLLYGQRHPASKFCAMSYWNRLHWNIPRLSLNAVRRTPTVTTLLCNWRSIYSFHTY